MAAARISNILIANQVIGRAKIDRLVCLIRKMDARIIVAVDNPDNVREIGQTAAAQGVTVGVLVEIDLGMKRAGVATGEEALALAQLSYRTPGIEYRGLMGWEGHTVGIKDSKEKREAIEKAIDLLRQTAELCQAAGLPVEIISAGGSATFFVTAFLSPITEVQAGGGVFSDVLYQTRGVQNQPALFVRSTVSSTPTPDRLIFDAGFKALPDWKARPQPVGLTDVLSVRMSAEHATVTLAKPNPQIHIGDAFDFVISYGDYTVCLHDELYGIRQGKVEAIWPIEGRGKLR
jgi:D-serine deaminase-like pyridoxal phosphate-dependent protein